MAKQNHKNSTRSRAGGELPIVEDLEFQRREWNAQRAGWVIMGLVLIAALLGLFGTGPISSSSAERGGLRLEYERFGRLHRPTSLHFHFSADRQESATIAISRKYLQSVQVEHITPQPQKVESDPQWLIYYFLTRSGPADATFHLKPDKFGAVAGQARLGQGEPISFGQFIYP